MENNQVFNQKIKKHSLEVIKHGLNGFKYFEAYVKNQSIVNKYDWVQYHPHAKLMTMTLYWQISEDQKDQLLPNITDLIHIIKSMVNDYKEVFGTNASIYLEFLEGTLLSLNNIKQSYLITQDSPEL